jgi:cell division protein FtsQ
MKESEDHAPNARTWREIPQPVRPRTMSREGRKRFALATLKTTGLAVGAAALVWGVVEIAGIWQAEPKRIARAVGTAFVSRIEVRTDGRLGQDWVERTLDLPKNVTLMELDLARLQQRLLAYGQVRSVRLAKQFPSTLSVSLTERSPVARLRAEDGRDLLVARDGVIFAGVGYKEAGVTESLPWLDGIKLERTAAGFAPIDDMVTVAELLAKAHIEAPGLYRTWTVVNLARLKSDSEIEVRSTDIEKIIFSTQLDFLTQIARLDYVRDAQKVPLKAVNVGLGPQVVVDYDTAAVMDKPAPNAARSVSGYRFILPDSNLPAHRPTHRDL